MIKKIPTVRYGDDTRPTPEPTNPPANPAPPAVTYTQEQVNQAIAAATKNIHEEHARLTADLNRVIAEKEAAFTELQSRFNALTESVKQDVSGAKVDVEGLMEKYSAKSRQAMEGVYAAKMAEMQATIDALTSQQKAVSAAELRNRLIAENGGESVMVVELVQGSDEATILKEIEKAKAAYSRLIPANPGTTTTAPSLPTLPAPVQPPTGGATGGNSGGTDVRRMDRKTYASRREELLRQAADRAGSRRQGLPR